MSKTNIPDQSVPLAERMRPAAVDQFYGQHHLLAEERVLFKLLKSDKIPSLIFWGPPGSGKTSLAQVISATTGSYFVFFSAVLSGVKEIRQIVAAGNREAAKWVAMYLPTCTYRFNRRLDDNERYLRENR